MKNIENDIANEIINIGLGKAADSMAFFTKEKVLIRGLNVQKLKISEIDQIHSCTTEEISCVLSTELKGDIKGFCYLIFTEKDVEKLLEVSLPKSIRDDKEKLRVMGDAILLEMDNIIVASVVTQFSNFFNYTMYGDVPRITKKDCNGLKNMMIEENKEKESFLYFKSEMHTENLDICCDFVWMLDDNYFKGVKTLAANDKVLLKLRNK